MAKKKLSEQEEKEIKILQSTNEMLTKTLNDVKLRGDNDVIKRVTLAKEDIVNKIKTIDNEYTENLEEVDIVSEMLKNNYDETIEERLETKTFNESFKPNEVEYETNDVQVSSLNDYSTNIIANDDFNNIDDDMNYDIISLPSKGQCYVNKLERVPVGYLTAYDENFITSPNLYRDGLIIDFLLKHKIKNNNINIDELVSGDVDAIVLFLRATSYGVDFPIVVRDP